MGVDASRRAEVLGWLALAALLVVLVPPFLCMPLTVDAAFYDTCARHVLRGGALERDLLYLPPPGMPWALALVRVTLGTSSVAARAADLAVVAGIIALLAAWLRAMGVPRAARVWFAAALAAVYLTTTEWVQVQVDTWMLLPALAALHLRRHRFEGLATPGAVVEGVCWGMACLFKPFVLVPAGACWLASAVLLRQQTRRWAPLVLDAACLLAGGLLAAATWQSWLLSSGSWSAYWHNFFDIRSDYYVISLPWQQRVAIVFTGLWPWTLLHLPGLVVAGLVALALFRPSASAGARAGGALLAATYLGWLAQANFIQSQNAYHMLPTVFLALALLAGWVSGLPVRRAAWAGLFGVALAVAVCQPAARPQRLALWGRCWREGSSAEMRNRLALDREWFWTPDWVELGQVADFLREQGVKDGELICYSASTVHLYTALDVRPATPYLYPSVYLGLFPGHRASIVNSLRGGPARFLVTDAHEVVRHRGMEVDVPAGGTTAVYYPESEPVVFQAGRYSVRRPGGAP
jgi:hypothetical protein